MSNEILLDAPLLHKFCASLPKAEQQALREAADTGGIVLRVKSLRLDPNRLIIFGVIPSAALVFGHSSECPAYLQPRSIGSLHLTWSSLLHPDADGEIGYLVVQTPVTVPSRLQESEDGDSLWVALSIERTFRSLAQHSIGAVCCMRCSRPISRQRLLAVPNTKICTNCKQTKEKP